MIKSHLKYHDEFQEHKKKPININIHLLCVCIKCFYMEKGTLQTAREQRIKCHYIVFIKFTPGLETSHGNFVLHCFRFVLPSLQLKRVVECHCMLTVLLQSYNVIIYVVKTTLNCVLVLEDRDSRYIISFTSLLLPILLLSCIYSLCAHFCVLTDS